MATASSQPDEERLRREALANWKRIQRELAATTADLSDAERDALIDEISEEIKQRVTDSMQFASASANAIPT